MSWWWKPTGPIACPTCGEAYTSIGATVSHMSREHGLRGQREVSRVAWDLRLRFNRGDFKNVTIHRGPIVRCRECHYTWTAKHNARSLECHRCGTIKLELLSPPSPGIRYVRPSGLENSWPVSIPG